MYNHITLIIVCITWGMNMLDDATMNLLNRNTSEDIIECLNSYNYWRGYLKSFDTFMGKKEKFSFERMEILDFIISVFQTYGLIMRENYENWSENEDNDTVINEIDTYAYEIEEYLRKRVKV